MTYELLIQQEAILEAQQIYDWYEMQKQGLGVDFIKSMEKTINELRRGATHFGFIDKTKNYRRILFDRFPCMAIYEIEQQKVIVVSIRYGGENPALRIKFTQ